MDIRAEVVYGAVRREITVARGLHGPLTTNHLRAFRILTEEVGEVASAIREAEDHPLDGTRQLIAELRQVAAVALMWLENLEDFKWDDPSLSSKAGSTGPKVRGK